jgi:hypothetical protein
MEKSIKKNKKFDFKAPILSHKLKPAEHKQIVFKKKFLDGKDY